MIPVVFNQFDAAVHALREKWVNASQWTGVYSSFPEGVVNMEELNLSVDSDVIVFLEYSENEYRIDGYLHSDLFCEKGFSYRNVLLAGTPSIWTPNRLNIEVYEIVQGHTIELGAIRIFRDGLQGIITVICRESKSCLITDTLRLTPTPYIIEEELEFLCLKPVADGDLSESYCRHE